MYELTYNVTVTVQLSNDDVKPDEFPEYTLSAWEGEIQKEIKEVISHLDDAHCVIQHISSVKK